jgi:adenylate kinase
MQPLTVLFFGIQGSGKGTQVKLLAEAIQKKSAEPIVMVDMGGLFREMAKDGTTAGNRVNEIITSGGHLDHFMPVYLSTRAIFNGLKTGSEHVICDGLCRGDDQTRAFDDLMHFLNRPYHVVNIQLSVEKAIERALLRGRSDDTEEAIKKRLTWYHNDIAPQLEILRSRNANIHTIDGDQSVEAVHADIIKALGL